jgi:hypothetical protein
VLRKLNFTERVRIPLAAVRIDLRRDSDGMLVFDPHFALGDVPLPARARLFVEAMYRTSYMRFDCGTAGQPQVPADRRLTGIDSSNVVRFRVKVVDRDEEHRVLALNDLTVALRQAETGGRTPLLPVDFKDLGDEVWRLQFEPDTPVLELNNRIEGIEMAAKGDGRFFAYVYPAAVREVLTRILLIDRFDESDESDEWWSLWLRWGTRFAGDPAPPDEEDRKRWIDEVVSGFCTQFGVARRLSEASPGER